MINKILIAALTGMLFVGCEILNKDESVSDTETNKNQNEMQNEDNSEIQNIPIDSLNQDSLICERSVDSLLKVELEELRIDSLAKVELHLDLSVFSKTKNTELRQDRKDIHPLVTVSQTTGCYGNCPINDIKIFEDGIVFYNRHGSNDDLISISYQLPKDSLIKLKDYLALQALDSLVEKVDSSIVFLDQSGTAIIHPSYGCYIPDLSSYQLFYKKN